MFCTSVFIFYFVTYQITRLVLVCNEDAPVWRLQRQ